MILILLVSRTGKVIHLKKKGYFLIFESYNIIIFSVIY